MRPGSGSRASMTKNIKILQPKAVFRIHMFLALLDPDPDPLVRGMDPDPAPDPDPSIIMQK